MNARRTRVEGVLERINQAEQGEAHARTVELILKAMKPLTKAEHGTQATVVLAPEGYNHMSLETKKVKSFEAVTNDAGGVELWIPRKSLVNVIVTHGGSHEHLGKVSFYFWNGKQLSKGGVLLNKSFTTGRLSERLGPFFAPERLVRKK